MIICLGIGPGDMDYLIQRSAELIRSAQVVVGFTAVVEFAQPLLSPDSQVITMSYKDQVAKLEEVARLHHEGLKCVVLFMGDIHFSGFQLLERVERACGHPVETVPGISSSQILASKTKVCFDETTFITFHRRGDLTPFQKHMIHVLQDDRNAIVIPRPWDMMPREIAAYLIEHDIDPKHPVEVWEHLTQNEASWQGTLAECQKEFSDMSIMLIRTLNPMPSQL
ncbi:MAG: cobalt-precorrin-7 (C(5))-methyltransferase [SAR324 cluster bacterium]|nr:cobalt-precorrin-7 (C(5))-methyltransferase [SAR324 cluster bacterium]